MWKDILGQMGDFDMKKAAALVDAFWDDREKILETANMVWDQRERFGTVVAYVSENQDQITGVLDFVERNKDRLLDLADRLPELLRGAGSGLETAGLGAVRASALLTGKGEEDGAISAYELTGMAALALERCNLQLEQVAALIQDLGEKIDAIRIPSINPTFTEFMGHRVMTGLGLQEDALADDVAARFRDGAGRLSEISDDFSDVAVRLTALGASLTHSGRNLDAVGRKLQDSGHTLRQASPEKQGLVSAPARPPSAPAVDLTLPEEPRIASELAALKAEAGSVRAQRLASVPVGKSATATPSGKSGAAKSTPAKPSTAKSKPVKPSTAKTKPAKPSSAKPRPGAK